MANPPPRPGSPAPKPAPAAARPTPSPRSVREQLPPRTMGATVPHERMRQVRFKSGIRDVVFGLAILVAGILLNAVFRATIGGSDDLSRVGGIGLIVVGAGYAAYGCYGMAKNTKKPARGAAPRSG